MEKNILAEKPAPLKVLDNMGENIRNFGRGIVKFNQKIFSEVTAPPRSLIEGFLGDLDEKGSQLQEDMELLTEQPREAIETVSRDGLNAVLAPVPLYKFYMDEAKKECKGCDSEEIRTMAIQKVSDLGLDIANVAWPGTAAPDAKAKVSKQIGKPLKRLTGLEIIPEPRDK